MVDTSADGVRRDARAAIVGYVETLRGFDAAPKGDAGSECVDVMIAVAELCREEGAAGEANRMAVGEVRLVERTRGGVSVCRVKAQYTRVRHGTVRYGSAHCLRLQISSSRPQ